MSPSARLLHTVGCCAVTGSSNRTTGTALQAHLQGLRQFSSARVPRVHGDERHDCRPQSDLNVLKHKSLLAGTQGIQDRLQASMVQQEHLKVKEQHAVVNNALFDTFNAVAPYRSVPGVAKCASMLWGAHLHNASYSTAGI